MSISDERIPTGALPAVGANPPERRQDIRVWEQALRRDWRRWTEIVESFVKRRYFRHRGEWIAYQDLHRDLLNCCRVLADEHESRRDYFRFLEGLVRPWLSTRTLDQAENEILAALLDQCQAIDRQLNGRRFRVSGRWIAGLLALLVIAAVVALYPALASTVLQTAVDGISDLGKVIVLAYRRSSELQRLIFAGFVVAVVTMFVAWRAR